MNLPTFFKNKDLEPKLYLALLIGDAKIRAALWQAGPEGVEIIKSSPFESYQQKKQLVVKADQALQALGSASETVDEVILGLAPNWTDQTGILPVKKPVLKKLTQDLGLKPVGFVVTSEALAKHLTQKNKRLSCLLLEIGQNYLALSYLKQGQLLISKQVGRSAQTLADMTEALARLNAHHEDQHQEQLHFPPKILVASFELDAADLAEQQQLLIDHDWVNSHPFAHMPTVDLINGNSFLEAIVMQGGKSVATAEGVVQPGLVQKKPTQATPPPTEPEVEDELAVEKSAAKKPDVAPTAVASSFGVPVKLNQLPRVSQKPDSAVDKTAQPDFDHDPAQSDSPKKTNIRKQGLFIRFFSWFKDHKFYAIIGFIAGLVALSITTCWWLATQTQAVIELQLVTKPVSQETEIRLDAERQTSDPTQLILAADTVSQEVEGIKNKESTGAKLVGEKAAGTVTIYNKTEAVKTFEVGTVLSKGSLSYTLDEEVEVASASVETTSSGENKEYGQAQTTIAAQEIGAEANLEKEVELQIANYDLGTYAAMVKDDLTGGSSREVRVVSAADQEKLFADLKKELLTEAEDKMKDQLVEQERLVNTEQTETITKTYSAEVGDEVNTFELSLKLSVKALLYHQEDLVPLAQEVLAADTPDNYTLTESQPQILSDPVKDASQSGLIKLGVNLSAVAKPELDSTQLKTELSGRSLSEATQTLEAKDTIEAVKIRLKPSLGKKLRPRLPKDVSRIKLEY